jgi:hypothetical protein
MVTILKRILRFLLAPITAITVKPVLVRTQTNLNKRYLGVPEIIGTDRGFPTCGSRATPAGSPGEGPATCMVNN